MLDASAARGRVEELRAFAYSLPKVELHSHLNGSISIPLLQYLQRRMESLNGAQVEDSFSMSDDDDALQRLQDPSERMQYCFGVFDAVYKIMNNLQHTKIAVQDVLFHYAVENTVWLELRTSLREGLRRTPDESSDAASQLDYLRTVQETLEMLLDGSGTVVDWETGQYLHASDSRIAEWKQTMNSIYHRHAFLPRVIVHDKQPSEVYEEIIRPRLASLNVALSVSISRSLPLSAAAGTLEVIRSLAAKQSASVPITGVDFSGNCYKQRFADFVSILRTAREQLGLSTTLHAGEKDDNGELQEMIAFAPERWGHLVYAGGVERATISSQSAPIELCPTSNMLTCGHSHMDQHHISQHLDVSMYTSAATAAASGADWRLAVAPISINTDDRAVFATSMTEELLLVADVAALREQCIDDVKRLLWFLQRRALQDAFVGKNVTVSQLQAVFDGAMPPII